MGSPQKDSKTGGRDAELEALRADVVRLKAELDRAKAELNTRSGDELTRPLGSSEDQGFFHEVLDSFPEQVAVFDQDLRFVFVNRASVESAEIRQWMIGRTDEDYCRKRGRSMDVAKERKRWQLRAIETRASVSFEEELGGGPEKTPFLENVHAGVCGDRRRLGAAVAHRLRR